MPPEESQQEPPTAGDPAVTEAPTEPVRRFGRQPFEGFFERERVRAMRTRSRRRILVISIAIHVLVFGGLAVASLWTADELWSPDVPVSVTSGDDDDDALGHKRSGARPRVARTNTDRVIGVRVRAVPGGSETVQGRIDEPVDRWTDAYLRAVVDRVRARLAYPAEARAGRLAAGVTLRLAVGHEGDLVEAVVKKPCPSELLCGAVVAAARAAGPFGSHDGSRGDPWHISIPIEFRAGP